MRAVGQKSKNSLAHPSQKRTRCKACPLYRCRQVVPVGLHQLLVCLPGLKHLQVSQQVNSQGGGWQHDIDKCPICGAHGCRPQAHPITTPQVLRPAEVSTPAAALPSWGASTKFIGPDATKTPRQQKAQQPVASQFSARQLIAVHIPTGPTYPSPGCGL